ncbi:MAG: hypothetical protein V7K97_19955 [Nostoc sp.]|uniref:hypothetical protein n=1 Tax=Nostoc sp. TaxID=1180 RepID=UPI002FF7DF69
MFNKNLATTVATVGLMMTVSISAAQANPNAMTWTVLGSPLQLGGKTYVLFGADYSPSGITNPYVGDTSINEYRSLLCIKKNPLLPAPVGLPPSYLTPGGATAGSWSGGTVLVIPNIQGTQLTSLAVANRICNQVGQIVRGTPGYRMAEFHDGTGIYSGWSFWTEAYDYINGLAQSPPTRYWVYINDQPAANPW